MKRSATNAQADVLNMHSNEATVYKSSPARSGPRLPRTSLSGPASSCPSDSPSRQEVRLSCAIEVLVCRSPSSMGSAGRYISSDNGPKADKMPSTKAIQMRLDRAGA